MRVGIITIYDAFNYGSYLQAYAMQKILEKLGHEVTILDCSRSKYLKIRNIISKRPSQFIVKLKKLMAYSKSWNELNIKSYKKQQFDIIIIGSDEVWNIKNKSFEHWPEYFGYNLNARKVIAYAPSCGFTTFEELTNDKYCVNGIKQLDHIFARDDITKSICEAIRGCECKKVVDPTLLYLDRWKNEAKPYPNIADNYILYYSYNQKPLMLNHIKQFAKEKNLKVIVAGFKYDWCDESLIVEPKQFLTLMKNAKYVVTTTFHGSVFAVIFKRKFIGFYPNKNPKVHDFLKQVGLEHRVYIQNMPYYEFKNILEETIDYNNIHNKLKEKIKGSMELLINAMS